MERDDAIAECHCGVVIVESYCVERATTSTGSYRASILFERGSLRKEVVCETCAVCAVHSERRENVSVMSDCARACVAVRVYAIRAKRERVVARSRLY